jgi:plasmid stabilization system protein ParE
MPDKYSIRYLPIAADDLMAIFDWIAAGSPARAISFTDKLDKRISNLAAHSSLGRIPKHEKLRAFGYRVLVVESYLVFYVARGHIIEIHRVVHGSRHLDEIA